MNEGMVLKIEWHKQGRREYIAIPDGMRLSAQPMAHDTAFATVTTAGDRAKVVDPFDEMVPVGRDTASKYGIIEGWSFSVSEDGDRIVKHLGHITTRAYLDVRTEECRDKCPYEMRWDCGVAYLMHAGRTIDVFK